MASSSTMTTTQTTPSESTFTTRLRSALGRDTPFETATPSSADTDIAREQANSTESEDTWSSRLADALGHPALPHPSAPLPHEGPALQQQEEEGEEHSLSLLNARIHLLLTPHPLHPLPLYASVKHPDAGAVVTFVGTTRRFTPAPASQDQHQQEKEKQKATTSLHYSSYHPLALRTLSDIATSLLAKHGLTRLTIAHRTGRVDVGEESIVVCASAPHRGAAIGGVQEVVEEVKRRVEVWKFESFEGEEEGVWRGN